MKKTERKKLIDKLDSLARKSILERERNTCTKCGCQRTDENIEVHHIIKRARLPVRFAEDNLVLLCKWPDDDKSVPCHTWAEEHPILAKMWFQRHFPERWDNISEFENAIVKVESKQLEELLEKMK